MAIPKESRSKFLQKQLDEKEFSISWNFIFSMKGIDSTYKILLSLMCNDLYMNGMITWKQSTYGDKMGLSRQSMNNMFNRLIEVGVLIPEYGNKPGSKQNKYQFSINNVSALKTKSNGFKKKPVNPHVHSCKPPCTTPVNPHVHSCKPPFTYNTDNKSFNKDLISEEENILDVSSSKVIGDLELHEFLSSINDI